MERRDQGDGAEEPRQGEGGARPDARRAARRSRQAGHGAEKGVPGEDASGGGLPGKKSARKAERGHDGSDDGRDDGREGAPFGTANVSLLVRLLCSPHAQVGWTQGRRRAHAQALVDLARDHWFTDEELEAIERAIC